jgi:hypothetical protein
MRPRNPYQRGLPGTIATPMVTAMIAKGHLDEAEADAVLHWPGGTVTRGRSAVRAVLQQLINVHQWWRAARRRHPGA